MTLGIIVHGGAKTISDDKAKANHAGCLAAVEAGWGSAKNAVDAAIRILEDSPTFNASIGATLDSDGEVFLDAAMMEGTTLGWGGVAAVQGIPHPISVARKIMEDKPMLLVSRGAERFAAEHGQARVGWAYNSQDMAVAYMTAVQDRAAVFTNKEESRQLKTL